MKSGSLKTKSGVHRTGALIFLYFAPEINTAPPPALVLAPSAPGHALKKPASKAAFPRPPLNAGLFG
ncbi:MAG: hypothetical protein LBR53_08445 [Deltaproteobacteria bacterium]|nr:hypothetical protein [Deltaproteobacteria bacterium]